MNPFHTHLEVCRRCQTQPLALCAFGAAILAQVVKTLRQVQPVATWRCVDAPARPRLA